MFSNNYIQRRTAPENERGCFLCHKPTTSVLVNEIPEADHFYACDVHLNDPGFATQDSNNLKEIESQNTRQKEFLELKAKWDSNQKKKDSDKPNKDKEGSEHASEAEVSVEPALQERKIKPLYHLNRGVYNLRVGTYRKAADQQRLQKMLSQPDLFPSVPTHKPSQNPKGSNGKKA